MTSLRGSGRDSAVLDALDAADGRGDGCPVRGSTFSLSLGDANDICHERRVSNEQQRRDQEGARGDWRRGSERKEKSLGSKVRKV